MLLADDFHLEAGRVGGRSNFRPALFAFFVLCVVIGCLLSWSKRPAARLRSGLGQRAPAWFVTWTRQTAKAKYMRVRSFEEALGRVVFRAANEHSCHRSALSRAVGCGTE